MQPIFKNLTSEELVSFGSQPGKQLELAQKQLEVAKKYSSMDFNDVRISAHLNGIPLPILGFEELMRMTREKYKDQSNEAKRQLEADSRSKLILSASSEFSKYLFNNATQIKEILNSARYSKMSFSDARRGVPERVDIQGIGCAASGFGCAIGAASLPILAALPGGRVGVIRVYCIYNSVVLFFVDWVPGVNPFVNCGEHFRHMRGREQTLIRSLL